MSRLILLAEYFKIFVTIIGHINVPGQAVPKGLHYRMNLQTGLMEAKLLDKGEDQANSEKNKPTLSDRRDLLPTGKNKIYD